MLSIIRSWQRITSLFSTPFSTQASPDPVSLTAMTPCFKMVAIHPTVVTMATEGEVVTGAPEWCKLAVHWWLSQQAHSYCMLWQPSWAKYPWVKPARLGWLPRVTAGCAQPTLHMLSSLVAVHVPGSNHYFTLCCVTASDVTTQNRNTTTTQQQT